MMRNTRYELTLAVCACTIVVPAASVLADDGDQQLSGDVFPHGQLISSLKQTQLEVGLDLKWNNILHDIPAEPPPGGRAAYHEEQLRLYGRVPVDGEDATVARLDRFSQTFHLGFRGALAWSSPDSAREHRISAATEYGFGRYEYSPNGDDTAKRDPIEHSFDLVTEYRQAWFGTRAEGRRGDGRVVVPQVRLKYARDWQASDKVGVVIPGMPPAPATTKDLVIAPPTVSPALELRLAVPFTFGSEFGYAPSVAYTAHGNDGDWAPGGKVQRLRFEAFFYWFPPTIKRGRIGISPFVDIRTHGMDDLHQVEYGALIDLRFTSNLLEY